MISRRIDPEDPSAPSLSSHPRSSQLHPQEEARTVNSPGKRQKRAPALLKLRSRSSASAPETPRQTDQERTEIIRLLLRTGEPIRGEPTKPEQIPTRGPRRILKKSPCFSSKSNRERERERERGCFALGWSKKVEGDETREAELPN
ncbi:hypothetical protein NL676_020470 [Syzygium grande]|nr:hypothetical protein NL676_020470 [Syzygium grande]